jgi:hypothetical protein
MIATVRVLDVAALFVVMNAGQTLSVLYVLRMSPAMQMKRMMTSESRLYGSSWMIDRLKDRLSIYRISAIASMEAY